MRDVTLEEILMAFAILNRAWKKSGMTEEAFVVAHGFDHAILMNLIEGYPTLPFDVDKVNAALTS